MQRVKKIDARELAMLSMLSAIAFVTVWVCRIIPPIIPSLPFLSYEIKCVVIAIGAFIFGPLPGVLVSLVVCLIEMLTISSTEIIGFLMNVVATAGFVCPAAYIYRKNRTFRNAVIGLLVGTATATAFMVAFNYFVTPFYMGVSQKLVAGLLLPAITPFNIFKNGLNSIFTVAFYPPVFNALARHRLIKTTESELRAFNGTKNIVPLCAGMVFVVSLCLAGLIIYNINHGLPQNF
ncbi:MAG: ECF transporter S component [Oscillospiraceae bacterium]|jgi:riboflavin transporter FmnP|nr:ECF transporter S component [Oscillospiraceae bacterium]